MEGDIKVKTGMFWTSRYGYLKNGTFISFEQDDKIKPRRVVQVKNTII